MPVASMVSKLTYLAKQVTNGVRQPPNKYLHGLNIRIVGNSTRGNVRPSGSTMSSSRPVVQEWSTFTIAAGSYLDYNSALYWMSSLMGNPTTSTPGGGVNSRQHDFVYAADGLNTRPRFTFAAGYRGGFTEESVDNIFQTMTFGFSRTAAPTLGGSGFGGKLNLNAGLGVNQINVVTIAGSPTGGTFTITVAGQTTAGIAWNAIASVVQAALEALSNVAPGDVVVTGGVGGPYTLTWAGAFANLLFTVTSSGAGLTPSGTATTTTPTPGGVTTVPVKAIQAPEVSIYLNDTAGAIGTTKIRPYQSGFNFSGLTNPDWVLDAATPSFDDEVLQVPELSLNIVMRNDAVARGHFNDFMAGATKFVRYEAVGPFVEGAIPYRFRIDAAVQGAENLGQFGDEGGAETMPFPLTIVTDSTFANGGFTAQLVNTLATL